jgi:hypothetical protein
MINEERMAAAKTMLRGKLYPAQSLNGLPESELRSLRDTANDMLPPDTLKELDLEAELVGQFRKTKALYGEICSDPEVAPNQKAQVANSLVATLGQLVKMQQDLRREAQLKIMETVFIETIRTMPEAFKEEFFKEYEERAKKAGLA